MAEQEEKFSQERRKAPRVSGAIVEYFVGTRTGEMKKAFIKDICIYGICIYVPESIEIGTTINLDVFLFGDDAPVHAEGKVVWSKPGSYLGYFNLGIEFVHMDELSTKKLDDHIKANYQGAEQAEE